jgi:hypothetical protein
MRSTALQVGRKYGFCQVHKTSTLIHRKHSLPSRSFSKTAHPLDAFYLVSNVNHSLMSACYFNDQLPDRVPLITQARYILVGHYPNEAEILNHTNWFFDVSRAT